MLLRELMQGPVRQCIVLLSRSTESLESISMPVPSACTIELEITIFAEPAGIKMPEPVGFLTVTYLREAPPAIVTVPSIRTSLPSMFASRPVSY